MSPWPHAPGSASRLTKNRPFPFFPTGVGQKSSAAELTGSPRFRGAPHGADVLERVAVQMSRPPLPPGRFDAKYRLNPSGDWIGQPSAYGLLRSTWLPPTASSFWAVPQAADASPASASAARATRIGTDLRVIRCIETSLCESPSG